MFKVSENFKNLILNYCLDFEWNALFTFSASTGLDEKGGCTITSNQLAYLGLQETKRNNLVVSGETHRANRAREIETGRHNLVTEAETNRSNLAQEAEQGRHNLVTEGETARSNLANERLRGAELAETTKHNRATEKNQKIDSKSKIHAARIGAKAQINSTKIKSKSDKEIAKLNSKTSIQNTKTTAAASKYQADKSANASKYSADKAFKSNSDRTKMEAETRNLEQFYKRQVASEKNASDAEIAKQNRQSHALLTQYSKDIDKYIADKKLAQEAKKVVADALIAQANNDTKLLSELIRKLGLMIPTK